MFKPVSQHLRHLLLIWTMSLALIGVQLVQNSVLHDHTQHTVDCALCHFQLGDDTPASTVIPLVFVALASHATPEVATPYLSLPYPPYQGRAPPLLG